MKTIDSDYGLERISLLPILGRDLQLALGPAHHVAHTEIDNSTCPDANS